MNIENPALALLVFNTLTTPGKSTTLLPLRNSLFLYGRYPKNKLTITKPPLKQQCRKLTTAHSNPSALKSEPTYTSSWRERTLQERQKLVEERESGSIRPESTSYQVRTEAGNVFLTKQTSPHKDQTSTIFQTLKLPSSATVYPPPVNSPNTRTVAIVGVKSPQYTGIN